MGGLGSGSRLVPAHATSRSRTTGPPQRAPHPWTAQSLVGRRPYHGQALHTARGGPERALPARRHGIDWNESDSGQIPGPASPRGRGLPKRPPVASQQPSGSLGGRPRRPGPSGRRPRRAGHWIPAAVLLQLRPNGQARRGPGTGPPADRRRIDRDGLVVGKGHWARVGAATSPPNGLVTGSRGSRGRLGRGRRVGPRMFHVEQGPTRLHAVRSGKPPAPAGPRPRTTGATPPDYPGDGPVAGPRPRTTGGDAPALPGRRPPWPCRTPALARRRPRGRPHPPHYPGDGPRGRVAPPHWPGDGPRGRAAPPHWPGDGPATPPHWPGDGPATPPHWPGDGPATPPHWPGRAPTQLGPSLRPARESPPRVQARGSGCGGRGSAPERTNEPSSTSR